MQTPRAEAQPTAAPETASPPPAGAAPSRPAPGDKAPRASRAPSIIVGVIVAAVAGLSIWFLVRPQPLLVQGEVDATRLDIAARIDGRVADIPVTRGENVA
ncbi:MAG: HlyD family secretion protein, partial [Alphaproteobacteria bacterium]|nr:HlyD family secretion protein [Alphaproteobacteria bacterium]